MTRPSHLVISGLRFAIKYVAAESLPDECSAQVHLDKLVIECSKDVAPEALPRYLGHEAVHVLLGWTVSELLSAFDEVSPRLGHHLEEAVCDAIGHQLFAFVNDNTHIIEYDEEDD